MSSKGWETVVDKKKPRKKPVSKRTPEKKPDGLSTTEDAIFEYLLKEYPNPRSCEDILVMLIQKKDACDSRERVWKVMDKGKLRDVCVVKPGMRYVLKAE